MSLQNTQTDDGMIITTKTDQNGVQTITTLMPPNASTATDTYQQQQSMDISGMSNTTEAGVVNMYTPMENVSTSAAMLGKFPHPFTFY